MDDHEDDSAAYEDRLRRRLEILKSEIEAGNVHIAEGLQVAESLQNVRYAADGSIDLSSVDGLVRSMALAVETFHDRREIKASTSLYEIQKAYFEFLSRNFESYYTAMVKRSLTPHQLAVAVSRDREAVAELSKSVDEFLAVINEFWTDTGEAAHIHVEDMNEALKGVFGGDLFPSPAENIASKCGLYTDTIVLPCPFLRTTHIFENTSKEQQAYYLVKHALNVLQYKELACHELPQPIVVVLPDRSALESSEKDFYAQLGQQDALIHASKVFGRDFESFEHLIEYAQRLSSIEDVEREVDQPDRVLFDTEWTGTIRDQLERAATHEAASILGTDHPGILVATQALGRMGTSNELLIKARRLRGTPIIDAPTSWQFFAWKLEYDAERAHGEEYKPELHVLRGLQNLAENEMEWLGAIPPKALIEIRKEGALEEIREILSKGIEELTEANPDNFYRTSDQVFDNIYSAFEKHKENVRELRNKGWRFAGSDIGSWLVVGSLAVTAAGTGMPVWGMAAIAADQLLDAPKLRDIPKSIKELAEENAKHKRSPVGMLFKYSNGKA